MLALGVTPVEPARGGADRRRVAGRDHRSSALAVTFVMLVGGLSGLALSCGARSEAAPPAGARATVVLVDPTHRPGADRGLGDAEGTPGRGRRPRPTTSADAVGRGTTRGSAAARAVGQRGRVRSMRSPSVVRSEPSGVASMMRPPVRVPFASASTRAVVPTVPVMPGAGTWAVVVATR